MKKIILSAVVLLAVQQSAVAQAVNDSVTTGAGYANNIWYSLENDDAGSASASNWHLAFSPSVNPSNPMTASLQFNRKLGKVYEIAGSDVADFLTADTAGLSTWTPLENSEITWTEGAMNNTESLGPLDYGFGTYNTTSHAVEANRIFIAKLNNNTCFKFIVTLRAMQGQWEVTYDNLYNSDSTTTTINVADYASKNFVYLDLASKTIVDRDPASDAWDLWFGQYKYATNSTAPGTPELITGVFANSGVETIQVDGVDPLTLVTFDAADFTDSINMIGSDWKTFTGSAYVTPSDRVYFIDDVEGNIWKVIMTYFSGSSMGKYGFSKEKLGSVGIDENGKDIVAALYPNPAADKATVIVKNIANGTLNVYSLTGTLVYSQEISADAMTAFEIPVSAFANGAYQVVCTSGSMVNTQRLVVNH